LNHLTNIIDIPNTKVKVLTWKIGKYRSKSIHRQIYRIVQRETLDSQDSEDSNLKQLLRECTHVKVSMREIYNNIIYTLQDSDTYEEVTPNFAVKFLEDNKKDHKDSENNIYALMLFAFGVVVSIILTYNLLFQTIHISLFQLLLYICLFILSCILYIENRKKLKNFERVYNTNYYTAVKESDEDKIKRVD